MKLFCVVALLIASAAAEFAFSGNISDLEGEAEFKFRAQTPFFKN